MGYMGPIIVYPKPYSIYLRWATCFEFTQLRTPVEANRILTSYPKYVSHSRGLYGGVI